MSSEAASPGTSAGVVSRLVAQIKKRPLLFALNLVICGVAAFLVNVYVAVVVANGLAKIQGHPYVWPGREFSANEPFPYQALLFWAIGGFLLSTLLGYWQTAGTKRVIDALFEVPVAIRKIFLTSETQQLALFMWGAAAGLFAFALVTPALQVLLALFCLLLAIAIVKGPNLQTGLLGVAAACLVAYPLIGLSFALKAALLFGVGFWLLNSARRESPTVLRSLVLFALVFAMVAAPDLLLAHDTGMNEGGNTVRGVITSGGFASLMGSGGTAGAVGIGGAVLGSPVGFSLGGGNSNIVT